MSYARILTAATIVSVLCTQACTCPVESAVEPTIPDYEDPCAGLVYEVAPYHDERNEQWGPGGTVHANGVAKHTLRLAPGHIIQSTRIRVVPRVRGGSMPAALPTLIMSKSNEIGENEVLRAPDPFQARFDAGDATVANEYGEAHDIVIEPAGWFTEGGTYYKVEVAGEAGLGAHDLELCGTSVTFAP